MGAEPPRPIIRDVGALLPRIEAGFLSSLAPGVAIASAELRVLHSVFLRVPSDQGIAQ